MKGFTLSMESIIRYVPFFMLLIGGYLLLLGSDNNVSDYDSFYIATGQAVLAGGVFAVILKSFQYIGVFKEELEKIIYTEEFLTVRNDLEQLWKKVSTAIYQKKFPKLSKHLHGTIMKEYLPTNQDYYYDDYRYSGKVDWFDAEKTTLELVEQVKVNIVPASPDTTIVYEFIHTAIKGEGASETMLELEKLKINDKDYSSDDILKIEYFKDEQGSDCVRHSFLVELTGCDVYKVTRVLKKKVSLALDPYARVAGSKFVLNSQVKVSAVPDDIKVQFISLGTTADYKDAGLHPDYQDKTRCQVDKRFKGLLFPRQGYVLYYSRCKPVKEVSNETK